MSPEIQAQIANVRQTQEMYFKELEKLDDLLDALDLTTVEACDELIKLLPECSVRFRVWRIRQSLADGG